MIDSAGGWIAIALRLAAVTGTTLALGGWVFTRFVLPRIERTVDAQSLMPWQATATRAVVIGAFLVIASALLRLALPAALPDGLDPGARVQLQALWRTALLAQAGAATAAALTWGTAVGWGRAPQLLRDAFVAALAVIAPALAHAGASAELRVIAVLVDVAHGLAAGAWVGALALVTVAVTRARGRENGAAQAAALFAAFHPVALIAAPTVFVTGLATAWLRMGAPEGIANSTYSGLFVAKLLLAGVVGYFGATHSKLVTKRAVVTPEAVWRTLLGECAFALIVLIVTAVLLGTPPID